MITIDCKSSRLITRNQCHQCAVHLSQGKLAQRQLRRRRCRNSQLRQGRMTNSVRHLVQRTNSVPILFRLSSCALCILGGGKNVRGIETRSRPFFPHFFVVHGLCMDGSVTASLLHLVSGFPLKQCPSSRSLPTHTTTRTTYVQFFLCIIIIIIRLHALLGTENVWGIIGG